MFYMMNKLDTKTLLKLGLLMLCLLVPKSVKAEDRLFKIINASDGLEDNSAQTIKCLNDGRMVVSTIGNINIYDGTAFSSILSHNEAKFHIANYKGNYHMYIDRRDHLWLKHRYYVTCIDLKTETLVYDIDSLFKSEGLRGKVTDLFVCSDSVMWTVMDNQLFNVTQKVQFPVETDRRLQDIDHVGGEMLLFYEDGDMVAYDYHTGKRLYNNAPLDASGRPFLAKSSVLQPYGEGLFQIRNCSDGSSALFFYNQVTRRWKTLMSQPYSLNNMAINNDRLYIASAYGYWVYDCKTEELEHNQTLRLLNGTSLLTDINTIVFDKQGGIWIGTESRGLMYSKPINSPFYSYPWSDSRATELSALMDREGVNESQRQSGGINTSYVDSRGWRWVGTYNGLQLYKNHAGSSVSESVGHRDDKPTRTITVADGLLNNVIHAIVEDDGHNIWVSTSYGISCLVIRGDTVRFISNYNEKDNVPAETFINGRVMKRADGSIIMQAIDHVVEFNPNKFVMLESTRLDLNPQLVSLMVNGTIIRNGRAYKGVYLDKAISRVNHIVVDANKNSLKLQFSSFNYFRPIQTFYRVRVTGLDCEWNEWKILSMYSSDGLVDGKGQLHLPFLALPPGSFTIEVQSSMFPYQWDTPPLKLQVTVNEPWWQAKGLQFLILFIVVVLLIVNLVWYNRNYRIQLQKDIAEVDVLRQLRNFVDRCMVMTTESYVPSLEDIYGKNRDKRLMLDDRFIDVMLRLIPLLRAKREGLTVRHLARTADMTTTDFYNMLLANIHKSPRQLALAVQIERGRKMLDESSLTVREIARMTGFASPNYFLSAFYHRYKMTPKEYRERQKSSEGLTQ